MGALIRSTPLVLMVDDDETYLRVFGRVLRRRGLEVRVAASGAEVARVIDESEFESLDGALLDVSLPDTCGTEIAASLRAKNSRTEIALVSGVANEQKIRAKVIGLNVPLITKPIAEDELEKWVAGVIARSASANFERALERAKDAYSLTPKEVDVVRAAHSDDVEYKTIAARLGLGVQTVHTHVRNIRRKTRSGSLRELIEKLRDSG